MLNLEKVLHVEDDPALRKLIRISFQSEWKRIDEAGSVHEALKLIEENGNNYQLIMLDLGLNGNRSLQDPEKCIETVRLFNACSVAPKVIYTGAGDDVVARIQARAQELGIYGVVTKGTFSMDRIRAIIENAVRTWREERFSMTIGSLTAQIDSITIHRRKVISEMRG